MSNTNQDKMVQAMQEQQAHWVSLAAKAMENSMKLFELNVRIAKESIVDSSQSVQLLLFAKDPEELLALDAEKMQLKLNRMLSYAKEVNEITSGFNAEVSQMTREQFHEVCENAGKLAESHSARSDKNQQPLDFMFSGLESLSQGYSQWVEAGKKLAESVEHNRVTPHEAKSHTAPDKSKTTRKTTR